MSNANKSKHCPGKLTIGFNPLLSWFLIPQCQANIGAESLYPTVFGLTYKLYLYLCIVFYYYLYLCICICLCNYIGICIFSGETEAKEIGTAKQSIDEHCESFFDEKVIDLRAFALQKTSNAAKEMKKPNIENLSERPILFCILGCSNN